MDIPTHAELVERYETFCKRHEMAESRFGREATGEPQLIQSIRSGRSPSLKTLQRVASFMAGFEERATAEEAAPSPDKGSDVIGSVEADSPRPFAISSPTCSATTAPSSPHRASPASSMLGEADAA